MVVLGQRVQVGDYYAIVKYMGAVSGTEGDWLGVQWEEQGRGKHDGRYNDTQYFTCPSLYGSFVRPHKLQPGKTFSEVLSQRYDDVTGSGDAMSILNKDNSSTKVDLVGMSNSDVTRAACLQNLVMREESIISLGDESYIAEKCYNTVNLDLSLNLIHDINDVIKLVGMMPKLENIQLKGNVLDNSNPGEVEKPHNVLNKIYLAGSGLSWQQLCALLAHYPNISELYVSGTLLHISDTPSSIFQSLTCLDIQHSCISEWSSLSDIIHLPHLTTLILSNNNISHVKICEGDLTGLTSLSLDKNNVSDWSSVATLRHLTLLRTLRFRHNPLIQGPGLDMRLLLIAMLPHVTKLNGTPISKSERLQSDIFYLKYFGAEYHRGAAEFHVLHPRYKAAVEEFGEPAKGEPNFASIKQQTINVKLILPNEKVIEKRLLKSTKIINLQIIVHRASKIPPRKQTLFWMNAKDEKVYLDDPTRDLTYYSMPEDCMVQVE